MSKLNRDVVARTALAILDEEGIEALSMRRLADRLGVGTMTLYGYFRSKEDLLDAAVGAAVEDFEFGLPPGGLRVQVRAHMHALRDLLLRHPALAKLRADRPIVHPAAFRITEQALRILHDAGFPPDEAARTFRVFFVYLFGAMLTGPHAPAPAEQRAIRAAILTLPDDEFPSLVTTADGIADSTGGLEQFDFGLELILDAIEARAERYSAASSHQ